MTQVDYKNEYAKFLDAHTIESTNKHGEVQKTTAEYVVIAPGGRPRYLGVQGDKELCITSDDIFSLQRNPGTIQVFFMPMFAPRVFEVHTVFVLLVRLQEKH